MKKNLFIADLIVGDPINEIFVISSAKQGQAKNGPYWRLDLQDSSGSVAGKIWSPHSQEYQDIPTGELAILTGRVSSYRDVPEISITSLYFLNNTEKKLLDMCDFMPSSAYSSQTMMSELLELCKKHISHIPLKKFLDSVLYDEEISSSLMYASAAKAMHHAYAGGLLEHTLSVCKICICLVEHYPYLDKQILLAGAICHDLGKIWELTSGLSVNYTDEGALLGHISIMQEKLLPFFESSGLEKPYVMHIKHLLLSHHGSLEFGSPKLPATAEALILHYADDMDAKLQQVTKLYEGIDGNKTSWSPYSNSLGRSVYKPISVPVNIDSSDVSTSIQDQEQQKKDNEYIESFSFDSSLESRASGNYVEENDTGFFPDYDADAIIENDFNFENTSPFDVETYTSSYTSTDEENYDFFECTDQQELPSPKEKNTDTTPRKKLQKKSEKKTSDGKQTKQTVQPLSLLG